MISYHNKIIDGKKKKNSTEVHVDMINIIGEYAPSHTRVAMSRNEFKWVSSSIKYVPVNGGPKQHLAKKLWPKFIFLA
jgi:hypothetical protein